MSPANIEAKVKAGSPLIGQAIAIGDGKPYDIALITVDPDVAPGFIEKHGRDPVEAEVQRGVDAANEQLARVGRSRSSSCSTPSGSPAATS